MNTRWLKIFLVFLLLLTACRSSDSPRSGSLSILNSDQTAEAVSKIREANEELKKIRDIYRESEQDVEELKSSIEKKEVERVKKAAGELVLKLNEGMNLGSEVLGKIDQAKEMNINETYRQYLDLKEQALGIQLEAFKIRFDQLKYLRDEFQVSNTQEIEKTKAFLREKDESFRKKMEAAREASREANRLAKESLRKSTSTD